MRLDTDVRVRGEDIMKFPLFAAVLALAACSGEPLQPDDAAVVSDVRLQVFEDASGDPIELTWDAAGADPLVLEAGVSYRLGLQLGDSFEERAHVHQVFFQGDLDGPTFADPDPLITHDYARSDQDENGLPIGLISDITAERVGSGTFEVVALYLSKSADLARTARESGLDAVGGEEVFRGSFPVTVE
jgi:hypothetical protein